MKFTVSMALLVLLLGLPVGCILAAHQATAAHPCCPRTSTNLKCPYDLFDSAKASSHLAIAIVPAPASLGIAPPTLNVSEALPLTIAPVSDDLCISNRILRI
jgi:hypothetical protein